MDLNLTLKDTLPSDGTAGTLVGRASVPGNPGGPCVVLVKADGLYDLTAVIRPCLPLNERARPRRRTGR
jgi:fumarylacetoacetate (FAA) hydrolase family protein